jgi:hypothetical protein
MSRSFQNSLRSRVGTKKYSYLTIMSFYINFSFYKNSLRNSVVAQPLKKKTFLIIMTFYINFSFFKNSLRSRVAV